MKIVFVIDSLKSGGAERTVSNISLALQDKHEVDIVLFNAKDIGYPYGGQIIDLAIPSLPSLWGKLFNIIRRSIALRKLYKKKQYDGIFTFMEAAGFPSVLASRETIVSVHDNPKSLPANYLPVYPYLYPRAKKIAACAQAIENKLYDRFGFTNLTTVYNAVDVNKAIVLSAELIDEDSPFILAVGRLAPQKGFDMLIDAFAKTQAKADLKLIILGEGEDRVALQKSIDAYGLADRIILKGNVDNPFAYYSRAEFFVLSSRHEGFPNILIEALACECPCIAFDCETGPNEIIQQGVNGLLVPAEDVPALTFEIDLLFTNTAMRKDLSAKARESIQHLSPQQIASDWLALI
ncbi:MAG: glycosyltransferase family 4 protein [Thiotrichaceae bacterium]|nr:glycosyltransferase family 4 protein [Thiotrichaceae bacterium]